MAVKVQRNADLAMPQPLARHLGVNPGCQQVSGVSMPQIMEANARQVAKASEKSDPFLADAVREQRRAIGLSYYKIVVR